MEEALSEIMEIPERAEVLAVTGHHRLPLQIPYIGMGSSYFAPLAFRFMGVDIQPEMASEFYSYISRNKIHQSGVILSQSGRSSETLWCTELFNQYIAVTNDENSELCKRPNAVSVIPMLAGPESFSSSKTYVNTLLLLFKGFGMDIHPPVQLLRERFSQYEQKGKFLADEVFSQLSKHKYQGLYIIGSGPNIATALEAALILTESTKLAFQGMPLAQYDHGPKEAAANSIVFFILAKGENNARALSLIYKIKKTGAFVLTVEEPESDENFSVLFNIVPFNFMSYYLAKKLNVSDTFLVGGKVTETE
ncbi:MAG: hypothetical protein H7122_00375 [Chitinophagaceae bacterium]|nr:hypothetical protein [Chitinophagaceae bacterium]